MSGTSTKRGLMNSKTSTRVRSTLYGMILGVVIPVLGAGPVLAQSAALLPNAKQQYLDDSANPVASGSVTYYIPSTSTKKSVWLDANQAALSTNPVLLDAAGRPQPTGQTYGSGVYRQVVKDVNGVVIWDAVTSSTGSGGGGGGGAQSEGIMIGTIIPWANTTLPPNYLYATGAAVSRTTYADLFTALTYRITLLCALGNSTISVTTAISDSVPIGTPIEASCFAPGTTVSSKASGLLTMSSGATATASVTAVLLPWGQGDAATTFNIPDMRGRVPAGRDNMGGTAIARLTTAVYGSNPDAVNAPGGSESTTLLTANLPAYTPSGTVTVTNGAITVDGAPGTFFLAGGGNAVSNSTPGGSFATSGSIVASQAASSGSFAGAAGGGTSTPTSRIQPTLTADYIVKALPDDLPIGPGVTSIQGMTGVLFCGNGMVCTAQTISSALALYATALDVQTGTSTDAIITPSVLWPTETTTTYNTTTVFDFHTFKNTSVTLTGDITTQTLTNVVPGKAGMITFIQDGSGNHTTVWNSIFKFSGGATPTLTITAGAVDILSYSCRTTTFCAASLLTDVK